MNGRNGVHGGGLTRTGLPLCQAVLGGVRPSTDFTPVREFAAVPVTVGPVEVSAYLVGSMLVIGGSWLGSSRSA